MRRQSWPPLCGAGFDGRSAGVFTRPEALPLVIAPSPALLRGVPAFGPRLQSLFSPLRRGAGFAVPAAAPPVAPFGCCTGDPMRRQFWFDPLFEPPFDPTLPPLLPPATGPRPFAGCPAFDLIMFEFSVAMRPSGYVRRFVALAPVRWPPVIGVNRPSR